MSRVLLSFGMLLSFALLAAAPAGADRLRPASALAAEPFAVVADATARAFDQVQAARGEIAARRPYQARQRLAEARNLIAQARAASPATAVLDDIGAVLIRLEDPSVPVDGDEIDAILAAIAAGGDAESYSATKRFLERARYRIRYGSAEAAIAELLAAAARIPYADIDAPLASAFARISVAMIELHVGRLEQADAILIEAERSTQVAVRLTGGEAMALPDVAAEPPAAPPAPEAQEATESEIPAPAEFQEPEPESSNGDAASESP